MIRNIWNREAGIIYCGESILAAAQQMRGHHVSDLLVVEEREGVRVPVGILSDHDLVLQVMAGERLLEAVTVDDIMSERFPVAHENDEVQDTVKRMREYVIRRIPVVDATGALVGILMLDDLIDLTAEQLADLAGLMRTQLYHEFALPGD